MENNKISSKKGKKMKGQFYTVNSSYILDGLAMPQKTARCVIEPFAGKGDLLEWIVKNGGFKLIINTPRLRWRFVRAKRKPSLS